MKFKNKKIAEEHIVKLLDLAKQVYKEGKENLAKRYVSLAVRISEKYKVRLGHLKKQFCKNCGIPWIPGLTVRVRIQRKDKRIVYTCLKCGFQRRYPYVREKKKNLKNK